MQITNTDIPREKPAKDTTKKLKQTWGQGEDAKFYSNQKSTKQKNRTFDSVYICPEKVEG